MSNGIDIVMAGLFVGIGVAVSGVAGEFGKQYINQQQEAACWVPSDTNGMNDLAKQEALPEFKTTYSSNLTQSDEDAVTSSFSVTLSDFAFTGASSDWGTINCRAGLSYTYTRPDKSVFTSPGESIISFTAHPTQNGFTTEMSGNDIPLGTVSYTDDPNPPPQAAPQPTPAPPSPPPPQAAAPVVPIPPEVADYDQGHTDRVNAENWINGLQGPEKEGALFWSAQRSLSSPESCLDGGENAHPDNANDQANFTKGCEEATTMLAPIDVKRKSDPLYRAGWNAPVSSPDPAQ